MMRTLLILFSFLTLAACVKISTTVPKTNGAFIEAPQGKEFSLVEPVDPRNAIVYIYRPVSEWGYAEVQAPSLFINEAMVFGLKSGAYSWIELHPGEYDFYARRPLSILFLKTIFDFKLKVEGGQRYFFRYSELEPLNMKMMPNAEGLLVDGPMQQVPSDFGLRQISHLKLDEAGVFYGAGQPETRWAPFYTYPSKGRAAETLFKR